MLAFCGIAINKTDSAHLQYLKYSHYWLLCLRVWSEKEQCYLCIN